MEWAKIKNIIIMILLVLNAMLLFIVVEREVQDRRSQQTARNNAIAIIRNSGVLLEDETVPRSMELAVKHFVRDVEQERALAGDLLGQNVTVEVRGGDVYRYYNETGWIQFHSAGEFLAEFASGIFPLENRAVAEHASDVLGRMGFSGQLVENSVENGNGTVTFRQTLDGSPILNCQATLRYRDGQLAGIEDGRRLTGVPVEDNGRPTISVATALMRLFNGLRELGDIYNEIDSIIPAYSVSAELSGPADLKPVWYVKTDTGTYQLDTSDGSLSRMTERSGGVLSPELDLAQEIPAAMEHVA